MAVGNPIRAIIDIVRGIITAIVSDPHGLFRSFDDQDQSLVQHDPWLLRLRAYLPNEA